MPGTGIKGDKMRFIIGGMFLLLFLSTNLYCEGSGRDNYVELLKSEDRPTFNADFYKVHFTYKEKLPPAVKVLLSSNMITLVSPAQFKRYFSYLHNRIIYLVTYDSNETEAIFCYDKNFVTGDGLKIGDIYRVGTGELHVTPSRTLTGRKTADGWYTVVELKDEVEESGELFYLVKVVGFRRLLKKKDAWHHYKE